ncbi:hypothetical protein IFM89_035807 [Coptis chinensis]|uniref:NB-ARC domain-containing protein n=1 Tax=Coptis chinensis TaxID=261450 RepID=A0A835I7Y9_9MAGN|nr:hypothetical protein IFM89_035807 [Coptis chinensis]
MDILRSRYQELRAKEIDIRWEVSKAVEQQKKPKEELIQWLENAYRVKKQVNNMEIAARRQSEKQLMNEIELIKDQVNQLQETSHFANELYVSYEQDDDHFLERSQVLAAPTLVGKFVELNMDKIWENLTDPNVRIITVYGTRGVGKTAIMMNINNRLATTDIFQKIFWVTVSQDFNLQNVQNDIALQLNFDLSKYEHSSRRAVRLYVKLKKINNFLIIFDDVWQPIPFEDVGIPRPNRENGCKIVLTTHVNFNCPDTKPDKIIRVNLLSKNEAWNLFASKVGDKVLTLEIFPFIRQVVNECWGLPIVIVSVGHAMRHEVNIEVWKKAVEDLRIISRKKIQQAEMVLEVLRFCYNRLKNDKVQKCFLYCAFFPEDYLFKPEELVRYWMAENFIPEGQDIIKDIGDGFYILRELQDANMLETFTKEGDEWLKMHDLFRDLAIKIMNEEPGFLVKAGLGLQSSYSSEWKDSRKISLIRNQIKTLDVFPVSCPNVSTILLHDNPISHISPSSFTRVLALQFLDMSYSWITELPPSLSELAQLRVLFLQYCTRLEKIPSLEKLKKLQVLSLCGTSITELPQGMEGLVNLKSLDMSETTKLESIPVGMISSLCRLEELRMHGSRLGKINSPSIANYLMEMRCLNCLAILTLSIVGSQDHLDSIMCLQKQKLKIFCIDMYGFDEDFIEDVVEIV